MSKKKVIGIPGSSMGDNSFGANKTYLEFISNFGNPRIILPWEEKVDVDMILLPGGLDVNPANYGEVPGFYTSNTDVYKDFFMNNRLKAYIDSKTPIFGICLGLQQLAVYFGSKLTQNLMYHPQSSSRWATAHEVYSGIDTPYTVKKHTKEFKVNSHHHQAVCLLNLGKDLEPLLFSEDSTEDGGLLIEAFRHKTLPIAAIQYHSEELYDNYSSNLIKNLLGI